MKHALAGAVLALIFVACGRTQVPAHPGVRLEVGGEPTQTQVASGVGARSGEPKEASEAPLPDAAEQGGQTPSATPADHAFGTPRAFDNLTVLPVISSRQDDIGPITSLEDALAKKTAVVREMGAADQDARGSGAQVNSLVIENKGTIPIYVLAGTIVKGGNQDRQIGDDFIVAPHAVAPVEAYCVEHGRWTAQRDGVATGGEFGVVGVLTDSTVRTAAQYKHDQGEVWSKVAEVNAAHRKEAASGTLMATVDANDIVVRRGALAQKVDSYLRSVSPAEAVVGFAYAVDGKVRSVRWFTSHKVFQLFRATLVSTAAMEAITVRAQNEASGKPFTAPPPVAAAAVADFVKNVQDARVKEQRLTPAMNVNQLRESGQGYSSSTMLKAPLAQPSAPPKPVSTSVSAF
jgi:hypothetical protein